MMAAERPSIPGLGNVLYKRKYFTVSGIKLPGSILRHLSNGSFTLEETAEKVETDKGVTAKVLEFLEGLEVVCYDRGTGKYSLTQDGLAMQKQVSSLHGFYQRAFAAR